jgi:hypothetical protein
MQKRASIYPLYGLSDSLDSEPFDRSSLPFHIYKNVAIEPVAEILKISLEQWKKWSPREFEKQNSVRYAMVNRYEPELAFVGGTDDESSNQLLHHLAACLSLIRPMRQPAGLMQGNFKEDGTLDIMHAEHPYGFDVPTNQKLFTLRMRDAEDLRLLAPLFMKAMAPPIGKFQMAVQFHDAGHLLAGGFWKAKYLVWCSALEALFTSQHPQHKGGLVAKSRIRWFLGDATSIYPPGELSESDGPASMTIGGVIEDVYRLRNMLAHGDQVPDEDMMRLHRRGISGTPVYFVEGMFEAVSFIIRNSLLRILREDLLRHFAHGDAANTYFANHKLALDDLRPSKRRIVREPQCSSQ